jgi:hypothetical protein
MKNLDKLMDETVFDIGVNENIEDYKVKLKNTIQQLNDLIQDTTFEISYVNEINSEKDCDVVFLTLMNKLPKE